MLSEQEILHIENATLENALRFVAEKFKDSANCIIYLLMPLKKDRSNLK